MNEQSGPGRWSRTQGVVRRWWTQDAALEPPERPIEAVDPALISMLREIGIAMLDGEEATDDVEVKLREIVRAYSSNPIQIIVLPTMLIIQIDAEAGIVTEIDKSYGRLLRLDQMAAISKLVDEACTGELQPTDVSRRLHEILVARARFRGWSSIVGHAVLTVGFGLALNPRASALPAYLILGALVGALLLFGRRFTTLRTAMPVIAAFMVTVITQSFLAEMVGADPVRVLTPPLVSFLPGMTLTIAAAELTNRQIVAGSSRLVYGSAQLMLLVFGVVMGLAVVGEIVDPTLSADQLGWWAPWLAVLIIAVGFVLFQSAPRGSFVWIFLMLLITTVAQRFGSAWLTPALSGFIGALVIVPVSRALGKFRAAPPASMLAFPAFLLLVPGALGFIGLSQAADGTVRSVETLVQTGLSMFAIALGMVLGSGITRDFASARTTWQASTHGPEQE